MMYPHTGILLAIKRNKLSIHATTQMNLKVIILGLKRQKMNTYYKITLEDQTKNAKNLQ